MTEHIMIAIAIIFIIAKNVYDKRQAMRRYGAVKITYQCKGYFNHEHRWDITARGCVFVQWLINVRVVHVWLLKTFKREKYRKIIVAMKHRRALRRRVQRGEKAI